MVLWTLAPPGQAHSVDTVWSGTLSTLTGVVATADSTSHTKGAWAEIVSATTEEWAGIGMAQRSSGQNASATDSSCLMDLGVGGSGSETVILSNVPIGYTYSIETPVIPIRVPAGVRVAYRIQSAISSETASYGFAPWSGKSFGGAGPSYQSAVTYGANTSTSQGVTVTADTGTNNTFGNWTEIASATTAPIRALIVGVQMAGDTDIGTGGWRLEVGVGGAGAEVALVEVSSTTNSAEYARSWGSASQGVATSLPYTPNLTVTVPEGARLAARLMTANSTGLTPSVDVVLIGLR